MKKIYLILILFNLTFNLGIYCQKIYINSIPKAGTFLLVKCIKLLTNRNPKNIGCCEKVAKDELPEMNKDSIFFYHIAFSNKAHQVLIKNNFKGVFIYRDPRDRLISAAYWVLKHEHLYKGKGIKDPKKVNFSEFIKSLIIENDKTYKIFIPWLKIPLFYSLKYEDLVGPQGNGNFKKQIDILKEICEHLKIKYNSKLLQFCAKNIYGNNNGIYTFREGKIGTWKKYFTKEHKELFKKVSGDLLIKLGYEKDMNW